MNLRVNNVPRTTTVPRFDNVVPFGALSCDTVSFSGIKSIKQDLGREAGMTLAVRQPVYVVGHKNPDADSVLSAVAYSYLKSKLDNNRGGKNYTPVSAGEIPSDAKFALDYFGVQQPKIVRNFEPKVSDVCSRATFHDRRKKLKAVRLSSNHNITQGAKIKKIEQVETYFHAKTPVRSFIDMLEAGRSSMSAPVVDPETQKLVGIVSEKDLIKLLFPAEKTELSKKKICFKTMQDVLGAKSLCGGDLTDKYLTGKLTVASSEMDTVLKSIDEGDLLVVGNRTDIQRAAIEKGAAAIIVTSGHKVSEDVIELAQSKGTIILSVSGGTQETLMGIENSVPIESIMSTKVVSLQLDDRLSDIVDQVSRRPYKMYPVLKDDRLVGVVSKENIIKPKKNEFILIDHNSDSQMPDGIKASEVKEIVDHHLQEPRFFDERAELNVKICGATATIVAQAFKANDTPIPKNIAGILLSAILTDTDLLNSDETKPLDRTTVVELAKIAGIDDMNEFGKKLILEGEKDLEGKSFEEILKRDVKPYNQGDSNFWASQVKTFSPEKFNNYAAVMEVLNKPDKRLGSDGAIYMLTDYSNNSSHVFTSDKFVSRCVTALAKWDTDILNKNVGGAKMTYGELAEILIRAHEAGDVPLLENVTSRKGGIEPFARAVYRV